MYDIVVTSPAGAKSEKASRVGPSLLLALLTLLVPSNELPNSLEPIRPAHVRPRVVCCDADRLSDMVDMYGREREHARDRVERRVHEGLAI